MDWEAATPYTDPGATAFDSFEGDVSDRLVVPTVSAALFFSSRQRSPLNSLL